MCCGCVRLHRHQVHLISYGCVSFSLIATGLVFTIFAIFQKDSQIGKVWLAGPTTMVVGLVLCGKVIIDWGPAMLHGREGSLNSLDQLTLPGNVLMINGGYDTVKSMLPYENSLFPPQQQVPYAQPQFTAYNHLGNGNFFDKKNTTVDANGNIGLFLPSTPMTVKNSPNNLSPNTVRYGVNELGQNGAIDCIVYSQNDNAQLRSPSSNCDSRSPTVFNSENGDFNNNSSTNYGAFRKVSKNSGNSNGTVCQNSAFSPYSYPPLLPYHSTTISTATTMTDSTVIPNRTVTSATQTYGSIENIRPASITENDYSRKSSYCNYEHRCSYCGNRRRLGSDEMGDLEQPRVSLIRRYESGSSLLPYSFSHRRSSGATADSYCGRDCQTEENNYFGSHRNEEVINYDNSATQRKQKSGQKHSSSTNSTYDNYSNDHQQCDECNSNRYSSHHSNDQVFEDGYSAYTNNNNNNSNTVPVRVLLNSSTNAKSTVGSNRRSAASLMYQGETFVLNERNFFI